VAAAGQIADIRKKAADAEALARAGKMEQAEELYEEALAVVPEIERSYAFFADREKETVTGKESRLRAGLARAEAAFEAGRFSDSIAAYRDALAYLPEAPERLDRTLSSIQSAGAQLAGQKTAAEQSRAAAPLLAQAAALAKQESWDGALTQYLAVLSQYPQSTQAPQAAAGANEAARGITARANASLSARDSDLRAQIASVQTDLEARKSEIAFLKQEIASLVGGRVDPDSVDSMGLLAALRQKMDSLQAAGQNAGGTAASLQKSLDVANASISSLRADKADLERQRADLLREKSELTARLAAAQQAASQQSGQQGGQGVPQGQQTTAPQAAVVQQTPSIGLSDEEARRLADLDRLVASYQGWATREDAALAEKSAAALIRTKPLRDNFLSTAETLFPKLRGLLGRVKTYDAGFEQAGRENGRIDALQAAIDIVVEVSRKASAKDRAAYFEQKLGEYGSDPQMRNFLKTLQGLVK
jgi:hypothetical protein